MGYLADIVADAGKRTGQFDDPWQFEHTDELITQPEPDRSAVESCQEEVDRTAPVAHQSERGAKVGKSQNTPPLVAKAEPSRINGEDVNSDDKEFRSSAEQHLHQHLLQLSQQTLKERTQKILSQTQNSEVKFEAMPENAVKPISTSAEADHQSPPIPPLIPSKQATPGTRTETTQAQSVYDNRTWQQTLVERTDVQAYQQRTPVEQAKILRRGGDRSHPDLARPTAQSAVVSPVAVDTRLKKSPAQEKGAVSDSAPLLRIEQINVVVESSRTEPEHRDRLDDSRVSGSRYFLRSL